MTMTEHTLHLTREMALNPAAFDLQVRLTRFQMMRKNRGKDGRFCKQTALS